MMELPLVFVAGLLGSAHCVGMCGGFAVILGMHARSRGGNLVSQAVYTGGRIFTYASLGAVAGACGGRLSLDGPAWMNVPVLLCLVAGVVLIVQGLESAGIRIWSRSPLAAHIAGTLPCGAFGTLLRNRGWTGVFLAGVLTGFLPCGLLYGMLALAASTGDLLLGAAVMTAFGLGTAPLMVATGVAGNLISAASRRRLLSLAAWCVVLTGALTLARGVSALQASPGDAGACPFCTQGNKPHV